MELIHALRLDQALRNPRVAFVGAGGKTTAIFQCAQEWTGPVLITSTTHLAVDQLELANQHFFVDEALLNRLELDLPSGMTLITGPVEQTSKRTLGVSTDELKRIHAIAETHQIPLLIEADGSRQLPIKTPAEHEPAIPAFVDLVVVVAGLSALGKPLTSEWVHRPEIFTAISGLQPGGKITPAAIACVMTDPDGGLKNIPPKARRMTLLNQADTLDLQSQAATLRQDLLTEYEAVIISSFDPDSSIYHPQSPVHAVYQSIAAVILAAGGSSRFGGPKQLLDWHGKPFIWHVAQKALLAGLNPVVVVCGLEKDAIQDALLDLPVELVHNPDWQKGQGTSVMLGTKAVRSRCGGIIFMLADQPQISHPLIHALINSHAQKMRPITGPMIDGQRANPVLFDQVTFKDLAALSGKMGGRKLFSKYGVDWIPWYDPSLLLDVDTPEDYARLLELKV